MFVQPFIWKAGVRAAQIAAARFLLCGILPQASNFARHAWIQA
jgi:DNA/RNA endonuclease G (NUC1)